LLPVGPLLLRNDIRVGKDDLLTVTVSDVLDLFN
jgi:hypothetical protein